MPSRAQCKSGLTLVFIITSTHMVFTGVKPPKWLSNEKRSVAIIRSSFSFRARDLPVIAHCRCREHKGCCGLISWETELLEKSDLTSTLSAVFWEKQQGTTAHNTIILAAITDLGCLYLLITAVKGLFLVGHLPSQAKSLLKVVISHCWLIATSQEEPAFGKEVGRSHFRGAAAPS